MYCITNYLNESFGPGVYVVAEAVAVGVGDNIAEGDGLAVGEDEGLGEGKVLGDGDGLGLTVGFGVALTEGLTEGFGVGVGDGEGVGVGSGVGLGEGEAVSPKTSSFGGAGNKTDLTQNPDPVNIKTSKTPRDTVNFEGLF